MMNSSTLTETPAPIAVRVEAADAALGAEITGIDVRDLDERLVQAVRDAVLRYSVVVVRDQTLKPEHQLALMDRLYPLRPPAKLNIYAPPGYPQLAMVSNIVEDGKPIGLSDAGLLWHTDTCFQSNPELFVSLYALEVPVVDGVALGDTLYVSTAAAFEALDQDEQRRLEKLTVVQSYAFHLDKMRSLGLLKRPPLTDEQRAEVPDCEHPLVRVHAVTGRKSLYVNESFSARVPGLDPAESDALLERLFEHVQRPEFQYRHRWRAGDLVIWDNSATQHRATFDYGEIRRVLHRCSTIGPVPAGVR